MIDHSQRRNIEQDALHAWRASPTHSVDDIARRQFERMTGKALPAVSETARRQDQALFFGILQVVAGARVAWAESQPPSQVRGLRPLIRRLGKLTPTEGIHG
jgi:hypothetical protein